MAKKPTYKIPTMRELEAMPWNGYSVASTFSGGGGSCTGYRMAGFRVVYANEFIPAARETYKANHPRSILDARDIRQVTADSILEMIEMKPGQLDLFDGSPPCSAFSTAGKREAGWGKAKAYSDDATQVVDDLFFEYARLIRGIRPKVFVAENVSGLVKGTAKGYFINILQELKGCGYRVKATLLNGAWLGVPQARERLIFIGVREDIGIDPIFPSPMQYQYTIRDAIADLEGARAEPEADMTRYAIGAEWRKLKAGSKSEKYMSLVRPRYDAPSPTITASAGGNSTASVTHPTECRKFTVAETKRLCGFPDDYHLTGGYSQQIERMGRAVPPLMMMAVAATVRDRILARAQK